MFIQIRTDNQIAADGERDARLEDEIRQRLARFEDRVTDLEVHVSDGNGSNGASLRCTMEARMSGMEPIAVADHGATVDRAVLAAAKKAARAMDHQVGKRSDSKGH
mgnify:CR=1 FL=1